jgi:hypothetical protein
MRIPRDVAGTVNAYLAFEQPFVRSSTTTQAHFGHQVSGARDGVGHMPVASCARQMRVAWDRVLGGKDSRAGSVRAAADDELALLR